MPRGCGFLQSELTRALKAAKAAGVDVRIEITNGKIVVITTTSAESVPVGNPLDLWMASRARSP